MKYNKTFWLTLLLTVVLLIGGSWFIIRPLISSTIKTYRSINTNKNQAKLLEEELTILTNLKKNQTETNQLYELAEKYLPIDKQEGIFAVQIDEIARNSGFTMSSLNFPTQQADQQSKPAAQEEASKNSNSDNQPMPTKKTTKPNLSEANYNASFSANWNYVLMFLISLENSARANMLTSLSLTKSNEDLISTKLEGLYFYKIKITANDNLKNIKISPESKKKLQSLGQYNLNIDLNSNFGRENPFNGY